MIKDGIVHSFILDSIDGSVAWNYQKDLQRFFPEGKHYQFASYIKNNFPHQIQYSPKGCSIFSEEHLEILSNIDGQQLYDALSKKSHQETRTVIKGKDNPRPEYIQVDSNVITLADFGSELGFMGKLLSASQSQTAFDSLSEDIKSESISTKPSKTGLHGETLAEYRSRHTKNIVVDGKIKAVNSALTHKSDRKIIKLKTFLSDMSDTQYQSIQNNRQGFNNLSNNNVKTQLVKKGSRYLDRSYELLMLREKSSSLVNFCIQLSTLNSSPRLKEKIESFNHIFVKYEVLTKKLNDPSKYNYLDTKKLKREFKHVRLQLFEYYQSLNKESYAIFKKHVNGRQKSINKLNNKFGDVIYITSFALNFFKRVYGKFNRSGGKTNNLQRIH